MHISKKSLEMIPHDCVVRLFSIYDTLKSAERKAADLLIEDPEFVRTSSIAKVAQRAQCSEPTFSRLAKKLEYTGFPELKHELGKANNERAFVFYDGIQKGDSIDEIIEKVFRSAAQGLEDTAKTLSGEKIEQAVETLIGARTCLVYGVGDSSVVARAIQYKLAKLGIRIQFAEDVDFTATMAFHLGKSDVFFAVSHSGKSDPTLRMARRAKMNGAQVVSITNFPASPLAKISDVVLLTAVFSELAYGENTSKRAAEMCVLEILAECMVLRGKTGMPPRTIHKKQMRMKKYGPDQRADEKNL